jgi:drug/metabolite transporter (DMT)-like permease
MRRPGSALLLGALAIAAPFMLIALGELTVPSGLAGVLASMAPMFIALFASLLDPSMEINRQQGAGLVVGLLGVGLVVGVHLVGSVGQFIGALALVGAAASGALSTSSSSCGTRTRGFRRARPVSSRLVSRPY